MRGAKWIFLCLLISCFAVTRSDAQLKPMAEGNPIAQTQDIQNGFFGEDETGIYSTRTSTVGPSLHLYVDKYDKNTLNLLFSKEITASDLQLQTQFKISYAYSAHLVKGKVFCFFQFFDNKKDTMYYMLQNVSTSGELSEVYNLLKVPTRKARLGSVVEFSPDKESFLLSSSPDPGYYNTNHNNWDPEYRENTFSYGKQGEGIPQVGACVYKTDKLQLVWSKDIAVAIKPFAEMFGGLKIDNAGNLFFCMKKGGRQTVGVLEVSSPTLKILEGLTEDNKAYTACNLNILNDETVVFAGLVSDNQKGENGYNNNLGIFVRIIDRHSLNVKISKDHIFGKEIIQHLPVNVSEEKRKVDKDDPTPNDPYFAFQAPLILQNNEGFYYITDLIYNDTRGAKMGNKLWLKDAFAGSFDLNGEMLGATLIPRKNVRSPKLTSAAMGIHSFVWNNDLYTIFSEELSLAGKEGIKSSNEMEATDGEVCNTVMFRMDRKCNFKKSVIRTNTKSDFVFSINYYNFDPSWKVWAEAPDKLIFMLENRSAKSIKNVKYQVN